MVDKGFAEGDSAPDFKDASRCSFYLRYDDERERGQAVGSFFRAAMERHAAMICIGADDRQDDLRALLKQQGSSDAQRLAFAGMTRLFPRSPEPLARQAVEWVRKAKAEARSKGYSGLWLFLEVSCLPLHEGEGWFDECVAELDRLTRNGDLVMLSAFGGQVLPTVALKALPLYPAIVQGGTIFGNEYYRPLPPASSQSAPEGFVGGMLHRIKTVFGRGKEKQVSAPTYRRGQVFDAILKVAPIGLWLLDKNHRMVFLNRNFCDKTGISSERYRGAGHYSEVMKPEEGLNCMLSDARAFAADGPIQCEEVLSNVDGTRHTYQIVKSKIMSETDEVTGLLGLAIDISDRKKAENDLKEALAVAEDSRDKIDNIIASIADGLIVTDTRNRIVLINDKARELLGIDSMDLIGASVGRAVRDLSLLNQINAIYNHDGNQALQTNFQVEHAERKPDRLLQARTSRMRNKQNEVTGAITVLRDVTRERELDRIKAEFLSVAAHELRTPLTSILGYLEFCMYPEDFGGFSAEQQHEFLAEINNKAELLAKLVSDLLDIGRLEAGKPLPLDIRPVDLERLIGKVVDQYRLQSPRHRFEIRLEENPSGFVQADENKLGQVLENLLSNAVKYSPKNSLVQIVGSAGENVYQVCVEDQGIGMTPEQKARVFDKFYRADFSDTAARGLGLGMSIVRQIIESLGGSIWVESEIQRGTRVNFTVPTMAEKVEED